MLQLTKAGRFAQARTRVERAWARVTMNRGPESAVPATAPSTPTGGSPPETGRVNLHHRSELELGTTGSDPAKAGDNPRGARLRTPRSYARHDAAPFAPRRAAGGVTFDLLPELRLFRAGEPDSGLTIGGRPTRDDSKLLPAQRQSATDRERRHEPSPKRELQCQVSPGGSGCSGPGRDPSPGAREGTRPAEIELPALLVVRLACLGQGPWCGARHGVTAVLPDEGVDGPPRVVPGGTAGIVRPSPRLNTRPVAAGLISEITGPASTPPRNREFR